MSKQIDGYIKTIKEDQQQFKVANKPDRIIEGYFTTKEVDRENDISLPSAFVRTMEDYMKNPVVTFMHDIRNVIGKVLQYRIEDMGVWVKVQIAKGVKLADEVWALIEQDMIRGFSYGFRIIDSEKVFQEGNELRILKDVELYEISIVSVPMNATALFTLSGDGLKAVSIKLMEGNKMIKSLTHNSTLAETEPAWSNIDKTKLPRSAFADMGEEDKKSTWKFPHHWVKGGEVGEDGIYVSGTMYLHKGGLHAAWAAANGARSGVEASASVKAHLQAHRRAIGEADGKGLIDIDYTENPVMDLDTIWMKFCKLINELSAEDVEVVLEELVSVLHPVLDAIYSKNMKVKGLDVTTVDMKELTKALATEVLKALDEREKAKAETIKEAEETELKQSLEELKNALEEITNLIVKEE